MVSAPWQDSHDPIHVHIDPDLEDLIPNFLGNRVEDLGSIAEAVRCVDYLSLRRVGHNLKGSGAGYGFDALTEIGAQIEQAALDNSPGRITYWAAELAAYIRRVEVAYD